MSINDESIINLMDRINNHIESIIEEDKRLNG